MQTIRTILAPTDFSREATNALIYAINLASRIKAKLIILHVDDKVQRQVTEAAHIKNYPDYIHEQFEKIEHDYLHGRQISYEFKIYQGEIEEVLKKAVHALKSDLVVMGRKGKGSVYEKIMGSITLSLLDHSPCAVMALPGECKKLDIKNITVSSDMATSFPEHQLYTLNFIASTMKSKVNIVKINRRFEIELQPAGNFNEDIREKFDRLLIFSINEYHEINDEDLVEGLEKFTTHYDSDLLVILKKNKPNNVPFFGPRFSDVMTLSAKIPLLIIPIDN